jgi:hypothetical protein
MYGASYFPCFVYLLIHCCWSKERVKQYYCVTTDLYINIFKLSLVILLWLFVFLFKHRRSGREGSSRSRESSFDARTTRRRSSEQPKTDVRPASGYGAVVQHRALTDTTRHRKKSTSSYHTFIHVPFQKNRPRRLSVAGAYILHFYGQESLCDSKRVADGVIQLAVLYWSQWRGGVVQAA